MEKKSLLERTNSWKPFIDEIQGAVSAKDYRRQTVKSILHIVDPDLSMWPGSLWHYLHGKIVGVGFVSGRKSLYTVPFEQFLARKGKVFENAPLAAIQQFNTLVSVLFPENTAAHLRIDEKLARRRLSKVEEALKKEETSRKSIIEWSLATAKELKERRKTVAVTPISQIAVPEATQIAVGQEQPQPLFSQLSVLDEEMQKRIEQIIASSSLAVELSEDHRTHERQVIELLEKAVKAFQYNRQNLFISLSSPRFFSFRDLAEQARELPEFTLDEPFLSKCFHESDITKVSKLINDRLAEYEEPYGPLIEKADTRTKTILEIRKETARLKALIEPFLQKKDLSAQAQLLLNQIAIIQIPQTLFDETQTHIIEKAIEREGERLKKTAERIETQFREFILQNRELSRTADFLKMMLLAARWECISTDTPYPDLSSSFIHIRDQILCDIEKDRQQLIIGKLGIPDFIQHILTAIYGPDVKFLRGELTARSLRLKDLRQAIIPELLEIDRKVCLLSLAGSVTEKNLIDREWLSRFLYTLFEPYQLFKDTYDPESINILFRYWWMDLERFLRNKESRYYSFLHSIEEGARLLIRPIARTLDTIEKIQPAEHVALYQRFIDITEGKRGAEVASTIDHWLQEEGKGIIGPLIPQLALIPQIDQEPLIEQLFQIERRIRDVTTFAKAIQAIKTFEPERIDSLLEVFSIFPFVISFDKPVLIRLQNLIAQMEETIQKIEEELVVELGLLDKKARIESGYAITNLLPQTLLKVPPILSSLSDRLRELSHRTDPYVSSIAHFLLEDTSALSQSFGTIGFNQDQLFTAFQKLTILLFHRKILDNALSPKSFARLLLLTTATGQIVKRFRTMESKGELPLVGSLIDELDATSCGQWEISAPDLLQKDLISQKLQKFIIVAKRIIATSGLTERREALLIAGIEKVCQELSEEIPYDIPRLSFVPGDLAYLWRTQQSIA